MLIRKIMLILLIGLIFNFIIFENSISQDISFIQKIHVDLSEPTTLDDPDYYLTIFDSKPKETLKLPSIDLTNAKYCEIYFGPEVGDDSDLAFIILPNTKTEKLYIDLNNDEDMTNDGSPYNFSYSENEFFFDIIFKSDPNRKARIVLRRKPKVSDSELKRLFNPNGNLNPKFTKIVGNLKGVFDFKGKKGSFYFDDKVALRRSKISIKNKRYHFGIYDYTSNGLFNDDKDVLIFDMNNDSKLIYNNEKEVFKLNDIITIESENYKISKLDKYGKWIKFVKTDEKATFYFLKEQQELMEKTALRGYEGGMLDSLFWQQTFLSLGNKAINISDFKGKYVLLNFWGEWCGPCIAEIPDLVEINRIYFPQKLQIISFLNSKKLEIAKRIIKEKNMKWPQIILSDDVSSKFKINSYPTNLLIFPDGNNYKSIGHVKTGSFKKMLK